MLRLVMGHDVAAGPVVMGQDVAAGPVVTGQDVAAGPVVIGQDVAAGPVVMGQDVAAGPVVVGHDGAVVRFLEETSLLGFLFLDWSGRNWTGRCRSRVPIPGLVR